MNGLIFQALCFFAGSAFSTGGGNLPGQESSGYVYLKAALIAMPLFGIALKIFFRPAYYTGQAIQLVARHWPLFLYLLICLLMMPFAVSPMYSMTRYSYMLFQFLALSGLLVQFSVIPPEYLPKTMNSMTNILSCGILLASGIVLVYTGFLLGSFRYDLQGLNIIHPNILASLCVLLLIWHGMYGISLTCYTAIFLTIGLSVLQCLLFSRAAFMALAVAWLAFLCFKVIFHQSKKALNLLMAVLFLVILLVTLCSAGIITPNILLSPFIRDDNVSSLMTLTNRTVLWQMIFEEMSLMTWITGYGYSVISSQYGVNLGTGILYGAHNAYLSVLTGSGIFALAAILIYLGRNIACLFQKRIAYFMALLVIYAAFLILMFVSEEIGINLSMGFSYIIILTHGLFMMGKRKAP